MESIYENAKDVHVVARKVYVKAGDAYAYADSKFKTKISSVDLHDAFIKGMVIVDAAGVEYKPVSCKVESKVTTVTYATTDTTPTTAKLATIKSSGE